MNIACYCEPRGKWTLADYAGLAILLVAASALFLPGLSLRSLWGSEGRWAVIAREMVQSGNYFLPTINGQVYFDKPLLSYWAIIPFSWLTGVTETTARLPGALAGVATVGLVYAFGRRLFGRETGFLAGFVLLTTAMFGFWSRTASAELLNVLAIWLMLWLYSGDRERSFVRYLAFYCAAAVSSFCKGPVAPAVAIMTITALSVTEVVADARQIGSTAIRGSFARHFHWILSPKGAFAALGGLVIFALLLFLPVIVTGSRDAVDLMWRENVTRFFRPFDHVEPFYIYFKHIPVFLLPWSFIAAASLISIKNWEPGRSRRWLICVTIAIFTFFTFSGSRRSYYILPIIPAFSLIVGRALAGFLYGANGKDTVVMKWAAIITSFLAFLAGAAMIGAYFQSVHYRHVSEILLGPFVLAAAALALLLLYTRKFISGMTITFLVLFAVFSWGFTAGSVIGERTRTLKPFAGQARQYLEHANGMNAMYGVGNSSLIFYLAMPGPVRTIDDEAALCANISMPGTYLLTEESLVDRVMHRCAPGNMVRVLTQAGEGKKKDRDALVLFRTGAGP